MKLSDLSDQEWFFRLQGRRLAHLTNIYNWWRYYDGEQPLYYVARILAEQDDRFPPLVINWCEKFIDSIDRRMFVEGFRLAGEDDADDQLWQMWQRNDMDEFQSENNVASLVTDNSYVMVGPSDEGALITVEYPDTVAVEIDPLTRRTVAGLKFYRSNQQAAFGDWMTSSLMDRAVLQRPMPDGTVKVVEFEYGKPVTSTTLDWMATASALQSSPEVPIVAFPNRARQRRGRSELRSLKPIVDAANQFATNMMATGEHHAAPRRYAVNVDPSQFTDSEGNALPAWKIMAGAVWAIPFDEDNPERPKPELGQFQPSDLRNFHDTLSLLARIGAGLCDLPPHSLGFGVSDNPASADGIRASEGDMVARVERHMLARGAGYERVMRLAMAVEEYDPAKAASLETVWRNPATPTQAAKADAAVKMFTSGLFDQRQALMEYGLSETAIKALEERQQMEQSDPELAAAVQRLRGIEARRNATAAADPTTTVAPDNAAALGS